MSERTHSFSTEPSDAQPATIPGGFAPPAASESGNRKWLLIVGGSAAVVLIGGILFQMFRPESSDAGIDGTVPPNSASNSGKRVLVKVGGQPITWQEVANECMRRYGRDVMENLVNRTIIQQACAKRNIVVTNAEVDAEVRRIARKFGIEPANWYQMLQAERGITRAQYRSDIIWPMLALRKIAGTKIEITKEEMRRAFHREYGPRVKAKMIMVDNLRRATAVHRDALRNPADFERLAQKYSIEPNSRALGGEIPPIRRYAGNDKVEDKAFRLRTGEISPVIQIGPNRFVILKCEGRTKPVVRDMSEVYAKLEEHIREQKMQAAVAQVFEKLKRETTVTNFVTGKKTGIQQASGTRPPTGRTRITSPYGSPSTKRQSTFR